MDQEILTISQVAEYLQISKRSVYHLVNEGKLPACKVMNKWRFDRSLVKQFISQNQTEHKRTK
jgi:excisionase family DNA binding protein